MLWVSRVKRRVVTRCYHSFISTSPCAATCAWRWHIDHDCPDVLSRHHQLAVWDLYAQVSNGTLAYYVFFWIMAFSCSSLAIAAPHFSNRRSPSKSGKKVVEVYNNYTMARKNVLMRIVRIYACQLSRTAFGSAKYPWRVEVARENVPASPD